MAHVMKAVAIGLCCDMQVKVKGARKITYDGFVKALDQVAAKKVGILPVP